jgi:hypothetical protein
MSRQESVIYLMLTDDKFFKPVLDKGARLLRHDNDIASTQAIIHYLI